MHFHLTIRRAALTLGALGLCAAAAPAAYAETLTFDGPPAVVGQTANKIYAATPGVTFAEPTPHPPGGQLRNGGSCGTTVIAHPAGVGNVARLGCGGSVEFPDPPSLFGKFKPTTRSRVSLKVGHLGSEPHQMQLALYDEAGKLMNKSGVVTTTTSGTTVSVTTGSANGMYFLLDDVGAYPGRNAVWVDDVDFDTPAVPGNPGFDVAPTAGTATTTLVQGESGAPVDVTLARVNGSAGDVNVSVSGLPRGVTARQGTSPNGFSIALTADPGANLTVGPDAYSTVTVTPKDANTGKVTHAFQLPIRVTPAVSLSITGATRVPSCEANEVYFNVAPHAGPAVLQVSGLPAGMTATFDGQPITGATTVSGGGTGSLRFHATQALTAPVAAKVELIGRTFFSSLEGSGRYGASSDQELRPAGEFDLSDVNVRTPQSLQPGSTITLRGDNLCTTPNAAIRFGSKDAVVPVKVASSRSITVEVPRAATSGKVFVMPDAARPDVRFTSDRDLIVDSYRNTAGFQFHNYTPNLTFDQMTRAFGYDETHYSPNICGTFTFGLVDCKVSTPIPDPWAIGLLTIANNAIGGSAGGGACFGFSRTSEQMRRGQLARTGFGNDAARNAWELDWRGGAGGRLQETINSNQLTLLSSEYLSHYTKESVSNLVFQNWQTLRAKIEGALRRGDHPILSLRDGGSLTKLHAVVAYDVVTAEPEKGGYYIYVYDSNRPFAQKGYHKGDGWDETNNESGQHLVSLNDSRIHVRTDNSWALDSTKYGASTISNIVFSDDSVPGKDPTMIGAAEGLKDGLIILFGWAVAGVFDEDGADATPPSRVTQVESGGRKLYSSPGVLNTDPKTALRAAPWAPPSGNGGTDGLLLAQGQGADYTISVTGEQTIAQNRTVVGNGMIAQVKTDAKTGQTDQLHVSPNANEIAFEPGGKARAPLDVSMMVKTSDGSTRVAQVETKTPAGGSDSVAFSGNASGVVIEHEGPATTVDLTLSSTGKAGLPEAVEARVPVGKNTTTTVNTSSWTKLGASTLTAKSGGKTRKLRVTRKSGKGAKVAALKVAVRKAQATVTVPSTVQAGLATLTFVVRRGTKTIGTGSVAAGGPGKRTLDWALPAKAKKGDQLLVAATTVLQSGSTFSSTTSSKRTTIR